MVFWSGLAHYQHKKFSFYASMTDAKSGEKLGSQILEVVKCKASSALPAFCHEDEFIHYCWCYFWIRHGRITLGEN